MIPAPLGWDVSLTPDDYPRESGVTPGVLRMAADGDEFHVSHGTITYLDDQRMMFVSDDGRATVNVSHGEVGMSYALRDEFGRP